MTRLRLRPRTAYGDALPTGRPGLGPLETRLLEWLWQEKHASKVRQLQVAFPDLAYTTIMTTLDRLHRKGVLLRRRVGRAFAYEPRCSRDQLMGEVICGHVTDLLRASTQSVVILSTLVSAVGRQDAALLDELDALVKNERRRLKLQDP